MTGQTTCEDLFVGCTNSLIDNRRRRQNKVVDNEQSEYVDELFVNCSGMVQDDSDATTKLTGNGGGSLANTRIQGGSYTFVQKNTKKEIYNNGGANTETTGLDVQSAMVKLQSENAELYVHGQFAPSSVVYGLKATNGAHIKGPASNTKTIVKLE